MNYKFLVKLSNSIGIFSILLLVYWVFTFILVQVFGLKVFRANITETFLLSILGILAMMGGTLMLNIMLNLTRIAEKPVETEVTQIKNKQGFWGLVLLFPLITAIMFTGDYLTSSKKSQFLTQAANKLVQNQKPSLDQVANYEFTTRYIAQTSRTISFMQQLDTAFNSISIIVPENINGTPVYLKFDQYGLQNHAAAENGTDVTKFDSSNIVENKTDYLHQIEFEDRQYLDDVFKNNLNTTRFKSNNGFYELFYPYQVNGKTVIILKLSDHQDYGKLGS